MVYIYIATVVVMLGLILFTSIAIVTISKTTCRNIKKRTMELASLYDYLLEEHSQELKNKKKLIDQLGYNQASPSGEVKVEAKKKEGNTGSTRTATMNTVENISKASYLSPQVAEMYQDIRSNFSTDLDSVLKEIPEMNEKTPKSLASTLLSKLSYDNIYAMSFLSEQDQLECIEECLEEKYKPLLKHYLKENHTFFSLDFYSFLKEEAYKKNKEVTIYVSPNVVIDKKQSFNVVVSDEICEGIQVEKDHVLYDYAIQKKEIG
ncbi:MAG: hypothetical protein R3Y58_06455 [Eubacteriales bacterium]